MSGFMAWLGRPLVQKVERKNEAEARLRFELGRVRENAEQIALIGGEKDGRHRSEARCAISSTA